MTKLCIAYFAGLIAIGCASDGKEDATPRSACEAACPKFESCNGDPPAGCIDECTDDLMDCSQAQVDEIARCATLSCTAIEDCVTAVACVDG